jgi:hypothetical protein
MGTSGPPTGDLQPVQGVENARHGTQRLHQRQQLGDVAGLLRRSQASQASQSGCHSAQRTGKRSTVTQQATQVAITPTPAFTSSSSSTPHVRGS